jgi:antitoxin (DNA-binding transcriptional repressor) of toxin-antitoxin stability system
MIQVTAREFRSKQASLFNAADNGETIIITRRGKPAYTLVRVFNEDILLSPEAQERIDKARAEIAKGNCKVFKTTEEMNAYFESLE